jgi:hypothetical protein
MGVGWAVSPPSVARLFARTMRSAVPESEPALVLVGVATMMTGSPGAKSEAADGAFLVPNCVEESTVTVPETPERVVTFQVDPSMLAMVARTSCLPPASCFTRCPPLPAVPAAGAFGDVLGEVETVAEVMEAATADPTPQAVRPETMTIATTAADTPIAMGCRRIKPGSAPLDRRSVSRTSVNGTSVCGMSVSGGLFAGAGASGSWSSGWMFLGVVERAIRRANQCSVGRMIGHCKGNVNIIADRAKPILTSGMNTPHTPRSLRAIRPWHAAVAAAAVLVLTAGSAAATAAIVSANMSARTRTAPGSSSVSTAGSSVDTAGFPTGGINPGIFTDTCTLTKTLPNDPIMMPGMTGMSMQHDFFGNPAVGASSTDKQLVGGSSSCSTSADASAYWTPVLYQDGKPLAPRSTLLYWRAPAASASSVTTMPAGISMIAGNEAATGPQSDRIVDWTCTATRGDLTATRSAAPHDCAAGSFVRLIITFPNCWDGHTLGGKGQTNVVYQDATGACPSSHPKQIPQVVLHVAYPTSSAANLTLSVAPTQQGPTYTGHADFMNGWTQSRMDADVAACIDTQTRCGHTSGPLATPAGGQRLG